MTTKELEKKLKISEKTCIHCTTLELAKQVLNIFNQLGLKWCDETHYTLDPHWDSYKESTVYYPFEGEFISLSYARLIDYKIINAEEFIALHTEGEEFDLENYEPKGDLKCFPKEIIARMLDCQEEQGNPRNVTIFEKCIEAGMDIKGFFWDDTKEKFDFWKQVIRDKNFNLFFEKYPKQDNQELKNNKNMQETNKEDNSQEFRVGDEVIDIITRERGKISEINTNDGILPMYVSLNEGEYFYTLDGRHFTRDKYPRLLHYRDDYNYDVIDFNNLPKRQTPKRWRTEKGGEYHYIRFYLGGWFSICATKDDNSFMDNKNYDSGNYFRTEAEAEIIAQKLNTYFKQLIQEEHEHERN